ncbi:preprotein translocase subunit SecG [Candidatus Berkelbacteria bacterium]|nr:preprotein translocase subunit SecG [Candidatus Berkelbacteria bacterium]
MTAILQVSQVVSAVLIIISILLQHRGTGIGGAFGGEDMSYRSRRGIESLLFKSTILFVAVFLVVSIAQLFV